MSEAWAIGLMTLVLGWVALELRGIRGELGKYVRRDDCTNDMCRHAGEIRNLWGESRKHGERITRLETENEKEAK